MSLKLKKIEEVKEKGWYVNINFTTDPNSTYCPEYELGLSTVCLFDDCWRSADGHPINPNHLFSEHDRFLGPFDMHGDQ